MVVSDQSFWISGAGLVLGPALYPKNIVFTHVNTKISILFIFRAKRDFLNLMYRSRAEILKICAIFGLFLVRLLSFEFTLLK